VRRALGFILLIPGAWCLIAPQANLGLPELRFLSRHVFLGQSLVGAMLLAAAYFLLGKVPAGEHSRPAHGS
jgi:hypothetical protein